MDDSIMYDSDGSPFLTLHGIAPSLEEIAAKYAERFEAIARANGYVKADDYEALKARVEELEDYKDQIETEDDAGYFDALAISNGYVKLADDEIVVKRGTLNALIDDHCADCTFDSLEIHDCATCDLKPIRAALEGKIE